LKYVAKKRSAVTSILHGFDFGSNWPRHLFLIKKLFSKQRLSFGRSLSGNTSDIMT